MKKNIILFLSSILAFLLTPVLQINVVHADLLTFGNVKTVPNSTTLYDVATCLINSANVNFMATPNDGDESGFCAGIKFEDNEVCQPHDISEIISDTSKLTFFVNNLMEERDFSHIINISLGEKGCYSCKGRDGSSMVGGLVGPCLTNVASCISMSFIKFLKVFSFLI